MRPLRSYAAPAAVLVALGAGMALGANFQKIKASVSRAAPGTPAKAMAATCPPSAGTLVVAAFGQSNSANYGGVTWSNPFWGTDHYQPKREIYALDWRNGICTRADDPLPGADGQGGSIWGRLGDELVARGRAERVLVLSFGLGATSIADWTDGKPEKRTGERLDQRLEKAAAALEKAGYKADFIAFQQGESDVATPYADYRAALEKLAGRTQAAFGQKMTVAISTLCQQPSSPEIARAIQDAATVGGPVRLGPDFDRKLTHALDRMDRCHLSGVGLAKASILWADSFDAREIVQAGDPPK